MNESRLRNWLVRRVDQRPIESARPLNPYWNPTLSGRSWVNVWKR